MNDSTVIVLTENIVDTSIEVRKNYKTKLPDAIIAATAMVHGLIIVSRNTKDFIDITGLDCVNPYQIEK
jgi:toxin FitB